MSNFSDVEKYALGQLRAALVDELDQPSDSDETVLQVANGSLVALRRPEVRTAIKRNKQWVPTSSITCKATSSLSMRNELTCMCSFQRLLSCLELGESGAYFPRLRTLYAGVCHPKPLIS